MQLIGLRKQSIPSKISITIFVITKIHTEYLDVNFNSTTINLQLKCFETTWTSITRHSIPSKFIAEHITRQPNNIPNSSSIKPRPVNQTHKLKSRSDSTYHTHHFQLISSREILLQQKHNYSNKNWSNTFAFFDSIIAILRSDTIRSHGQNSSHKLRMLRVRYNVVHSSYLWYILFLQAVSAPQDKYSQVSEKLFTGTSISKRIDTLTSINLVTTVRKSLCTVCILFDYSRLQL